MKRETYNSIIDKLANPDTTAEGLELLNAQLLADENEFNILDESNKALRMKNNELILSTVQPVKVNEQPKEKTPDEVFDELFTSHFHNNEKEV